MSMHHKLIGDKAFYRRTMTIAVPVIMQNLVTNFVSMLDNIMVGQLDTAQISAVTIVNNNLLFIFMLCLFGGAAGAGIFTTQYFGSQNMEGVRYTFRFKLLISVLLTAVGVAIFAFGSDYLIGLYLQGEGDAQLRAQTLEFGKQYMFVMLIGLLPFAITNSYASMLRECGHPTVPMVASMAATFVNLVGNYILIFGHFGAPKLGVVGAGIATVLSRYLEMLVVVIWTHRNADKNPYVKGLYRGFYIPGYLLKDITVKGMPLLLNEGMWSLGNAMLNQSYSYCGLAVVPALSIATTICNLTCVVFRSLGNTVGILMGQMLGAGRTEKEVRDYNLKLTALCVVSGVVFAGVTAALAQVFPQLYQTSDTVREMAKWMIIISAVAMPFQAYVFPVYFTLRSGGKTMVTFFFDCGAIWLMCIPIAFCCSRFTALSIFAIYAMVQMTDTIKSVIGYFLIKSGCWIQYLAVKE